MFKRIALVFVALLLLCSFAGAVPVPPSDVRAEFDPNGILISWQHPGGVSFKIYRGTTQENAEAIATVEENRFLDSETESGQEYWYFVTARDETGESIAVKFNVKNLRPEEKPFTITLVEPKKKTFVFGEQVDFVVKLESNQFDDLFNLRATLVNEELGLNQPFSFDSQKRIFSLSEKMPEPEQQEEGFSTTYDIVVSATVDDEEFSETQTHALTLIPQREIDLVQLTLNFFGLLAPIFVLIAILGAAVIIWGAWSSRQKAERDRIRLQLQEIDQQRALWRHEVFKRKITSEQFKEKEGELQGKQRALKEKLGIKSKKGEKVKSRFYGFAPVEAEEVMRLVRSIGKPKKGETKDSLRARLVGLGRSEKVAKKVSELVFEK